MPRKQVKELSNEASRDGGYVETDPTGRYGRFEEVLGKGAMKTVYKAIDEQLGIEVAWSQINLNEVLRSPDDLQRLYSEVHLLSTLNHDYIIHFYTSWIDVDHHTFNFITEMFTSGTLREYRRQYQRIDIRAIKNWARQILQGLIYLHGHNPPVIHRDLKCDNIFVNGHLGQVKIGDLGLARILQGSQSAHSVIGTPEFMAPELYEEDYNELVDVYSFGMCVLEMITSEFPYSECANPAQIYKKVCSGKLPAAFHRIQDLEAQRFVGKCLVAASKRVSAKELLLDPFLSSDDSWFVETKRLGIQKPFLNEKEMEKLKLNDGGSQRTKMTITGKLNSEDDTIFLKVQIEDKDGPARNVYFPFDILNDTPIDVAMEMVKELEIADWEPFEIAEMIDGEISSVVPSWKKSDLAHQGQHHYAFTYRVDDQEQVDEHHSPQRRNPFHSSSSFSSSQASVAGLMTHGIHDWLQDDSFDDTHSQSSSLSGSYSNLNYFSGDEHKPDAIPERRDKHPLITRSHNLTRFCPEESSQLGYNSAGGNAYYRQQNILLDPQGSSSSKSKKLISDNRKLMRNRSLVDVQSQLLHRSLVEEVRKRRLFKTVGDVETVGFQSPYEVSGKASSKTWRPRNSK